MSTIRYVMAGLLVGGVFTVGCVGADEAPADVDELAGDAAEAPLRRTIAPIGANGMSPSDFWDPVNRASLRELGLDAILDEGGALVPTPLLDTAGGRSVLDYTVRCALSEGATVSLPGGRTLYGSFGLAPEWAERGLTTSEQRWVSACLFQHLNGANEHVEILLEGHHSSLECPREEEPFAGFNVRDATMFGNAFLDRPIVAYACIDPELAGVLSGLSLSCPLDLNLLVLERLCGHTPLLCGVSFVGLCDLACTEDANGDQTCGSFALAAVLGPLLGPLVAPTYSLVAPTYSETIRTELHDRDILPLYGSCGLL
ncbi:hypothetical protein SOCE26_065700 [Sorangium cellulosum]|uniref:Uncharacterized protein n=1 Tax=Sorangium cellulosum TaxID=56 RepID=A0A2L0F0T4_SORCE|nr:hypothetical protein [Sorangium cellulosum]AUX45089.1 hypothetical protein SOCE26_065700 [Sorangium cellulosum]